MAKVSGLGDQLFVAGYDLSGDIGAVQTLKDSFTALDVTAINVSAKQRIPGIRSGEIDFNAFYNPTAGQAWPVLKNYPSTDVIVDYYHGSTLGNDAASMIAKQVSDNLARGQNGSLMATIQALNNGFGLEWGQMLTAGKRTDSAATNGTAVDGANPYAVAVNIASVAVSNPGQVTATAHGLVTGDSVVIAGTTTTPTINGRYTVTVTNANVFTIPVNVTSGQAGAAGTVTKTSTNYGWAAYLQNFAFVGTDVTVKLQDSMDNVTFADLSGGAFTQITAAPTFQRLQGSLTAIVREYVRAVTVTTGGVTSETFAVNFVRYLGARDP